MSAEALERPPGRLHRVVLVLLFGSVGSVLLILAALARPVVGATLFIALGVPLVALLSGNVRLLFLLGLMFVVPLDLSKQFAPHPHFGGEYALRIEASDLFLGGLYLFWLHDVYVGRLRSVRIPGIALIWLALTLLGFATITVSAFPPVVVYEGVRMLKMFALVFYLANAVVRPRQVEYIVLALLLGALVQILYGYLQYAGISLHLYHLGELQVAITERFGLGSTSRVGAMLGHPNIFAAYLVMICSLAFAMIFVRATPLLRLFYLTVALLGSGALILTLARAGWLSLAVSLSVLAAITTLHPRLRGRAPVLRAVAVLALLTIFAIGSGHMIMKFTQADPGGWPARKAFLQMAWEMIKAHPITGVGLNTYMYVVEDYDFSGIDWGDSLSAVHNIFMLYWSETGTFGLLLFIAMMTAILVTAFRNLRCRNDYMFLTSVGILAGVCGLLTQGQFDFNFRLTPVHRLFFVLVGLLCAIAYWRRNEDRESHD